MQAERRDRPGHPGYTADADGYIWSSRDRRGTDGKPVWRRLSQTWNRKSRCHQAIIRATDGRRRTAPVAVLILEAFVGLRPPGTEACHSNGDAHDHRSPRDPKKSCASEM